MIRAYFGHHKCGSSWVSTVLSDISNRAGLSLITHADSNSFNNEPQELFKTNNYDFWFHVNANWNIVNKIQSRAVHIVRDPRDVIISGYYSHLYSHPVDGLTMLQKHRKALQETDKETGLYLEMDFAEFYMQDMLSFAKAPVSKNLYTVCYEQLIANQLLAFQSILQHLEIYPKLIDRQQIEDVVYAHSFKNRSKGRERGVEDPKSDARKGQPGDWTNHFSEDHKYYFKEKYQPLLELYGYCENIDW